jgi:hypothetical protein
MYDHRPEKNAINVANAYTLASHISSTVLSRPKSNTDPELIILVPIVSFTITDTASEHEFESMNNAISPRIQIGIRIRIHTGIL